MLWWWWVFPALAGVFGLAILIGGAGAMFRGRVFGGGMRLLGGAVVVAITAAAVFLGLDVQTYRRVTYERPVVIVEVHRAGPQLFNVTLTDPPSAGDPLEPTRSYQVHGDEWRIEARVLKWRPWANVLGLDTQYQLDRLSGRYDDTQSELYAPRSVYDLRPHPNSGLDLWLLARRYGSYAPVVDTLYGSGAFMPMADGARYEVWITQSGLIARASNPAALNASASGWK